jgi:hypothetical protein
MEGFHFPPWTFQNPTMDRPPALGRVFYVDGINGANTNNGVDPGDAFQTITYALTQCVNDHNDYIIVLNSTSLVEPAWPVSVNVSRVHIVGVSSPAYPYVRLQAQTINPVFEIGSVQHYEIAGFELGAGDNTQACIASIAGPGTAGRGWIHHCTFAVLLGVLAAQDGIWIQNTFDWCMSVVEDCYFCGSAISDGIARDGIRIEGNATRSIFRRNIFRTVQGVGIHCIQNGSDIGAILNNYFSCPNLATGEAITMELGVGNAIIAGNRAGATAVAPAFTPMRDLSTGALATALNAWIDNLDTTPAGLVNIIPAIV